jgi:hypothetical protein
MDPRGVRSDLIGQFKRAQDEEARPPELPRPILPPLPSYEFEAETLYATHRRPLRFIRRLLQPVLKLFFNPNTIVHALHLQSQLNALEAERAEIEKNWREERDEARQKWEAARRRDLDQLRYEVLHNLVMETTRLGIEVKNLKMRVESLTSRLEFSERRARALERVVAYRPDAQEDAAEAPGGRGGARAENPETQPAAAEAAQVVEGPGQRSRRRRRRRGRRSGGSVAATLGGAAPSTGPAFPDVSAESGSSTAPDLPRGHAERTRDSRPEPISHSVAGETKPSEPAPDEPASSHSPDIDRQ